MTYNHERYISQAIDSVLEQQTTFPFEVIITEDCSTDGTRDLIRAYADRHPDRVRLLLSEQNLNDNSVLSRALVAARGQYVALLDGDDWWTSPEKLAKQVQLLDDEREVSICFHNVDVVYESGETEPHPFHLERPMHRLSAPRPRRYSDLEDLVRGNYMQTCSVMFRSNALTGIPSWYTEMPVGDWPLYVLLAQHGRVVYLDEVLGAYRVHEHGLWSARLSHHRQVEDILSFLRAYDVLDRHLSGRYHTTIGRSSSYLHRAAAMALFGQGDRRRALDHARKYGRAAGVTALLKDREFWVNAGRGLLGRPSGTRSYQPALRSHIAGPDAAVDGDDSSALMPERRRR